MSADGSKLQTEIPLRSFPSVLQREQAAVGFWVWAKPGRMVWVWRCFLSPDTLRFLWKQNPELGLFLWKWIPSPGWARAKSWNKAGDGVCESSAERAGLNPGTHTGPGRAQNPTHSHFYSLITSVAFDSPPLTWIKTAKAARSQSENWDSQVVLDRNPNLGFQPGAQSRPCHWNLCFCLCAAGLGDRKLPF